MSTIDLSLSTICLQRKAISKFAIPPARYEVVSPYLQFPQYKQSDFDMRRKAEILKYDKGNTKTNKLTRKQAYANIVSGKITQTSSYADTILYQSDGSGNISEIIVKYPDTYTANRVILEYDIYNDPVYQTLGKDDKGDPIYLLKYTIIPGRVNVCNDDMKPRPSSASGVPGPNVNLYLDSTVPLYNYATNNRNYAQINTALDTAMWRTSTNDNIVYYDSISNTILDALILNTVNEYAYNFSFQTPISAFFTGTVKENVSQQNLSIVNNFLKIKSILLITYFNNGTVTYQRVPLITDHASYEIMHFDISMNYTYNNNYFSGQYYLGMLNVSNLYLLTQPGYIYNIKLIFSMDFVTQPTYTDFFDTLNSGVICNTTDISKKSNNITLYSNSTYPYNKFSFSGV